MTPGLRVTWLREGRKPLRAEVVGPGATAGEPGWSVIRSLATGDMIEVRNREMFASEVEYARLEYARLDVGPRLLPMDSEVDPREYEALGERLGPMLRALVDDFDGGTCGVPDCSEPVGWHLAGDRDESQVWHWAALIHDGVAGRVLCESHDVWLPEVPRD